MRLSSRPGLGILLALAVILLLLAGYARHWWTTDWTPQAQVLRYRILDLGQQAEQWRPDNLLLGSSTLRWTPEPLSACGDWFNRGVGAATSPDLLDYVNHAPQQRWQRVLLYTGDNDIANGAAVKVALSNARKLVEAVRGRFAPDAILILPAKLSPARSQFTDKMVEFNSGMRFLAEGASDLVFLEHSLAWRTGENKLYRKDGIHLNKQGYELLLKPLKTYCKALPGAPAIPAP